MDIKQATNEKLFEQKTILLEQLINLQGQLLMINEQLKLRKSTESVAKEEVKPE